MEANRNEERLRTRINVAILEADATAREYVSELVGQNPNLTVEALSDDTPHTLPAGVLRAYDVLLLGLDTDPQDWLAAVKHLLAQTPTCGLIVFGGAETLTVLPQAMAVGARRYLSYPLDAPTVHRAIGEVHEEMRLLLAQSQQLSPSQGGTTAKDTGEPPHGKVLAAFSPKGGVGTTTLAVNLACALTTFGRRVVLVDGNICFGNAGMFLNIAPGRNLLHIVDDSDGIQDANIDAVLHSHPSGLKVLLAPEKAEDGDMIHGEHLRTILASLKARYDYVVVDTWPSYDERVLAILELADHVLLPSTPELPSVRNLAAFLRVADLLKYPAEKLIPILMRSDSVSAAHRAGIESFLRWPLRWQIVSDGRRVTESVNAGEPFVLTDPEATVSQNVYQLARTLDGQQEEEVSAPVARSRSLLKQPLAFVKARDWPLPGRSGGGVVQTPGK